MLVQIEHQHLRGSKWTPRSQNIHRIKHLKRPNHGHNQDEEGCRAEKRQGDAPKPLPFSRSVNLRRFIVVFGDTLQAGGKKNHIDPQRLPNAHHDQGEHSSGRIVQPIDGRNPKPAEEVIQEAEIRLINPSPDNCRSHGRHDDRCKERGAQDPLPGDLLIQKIGDEKGQCHIQWNRPQRVDERVFQHHPEFGRANQ